MVIYIPTIYTYIDTYKVNELLSKRIFKDYNEENAVKSIHAQENTYNIKGSGI